jgi:hypothetical protein
MLEKIYRSLNEQFFLKSFNRFRKSSQWMSMLMLFVKWIDNINWLCEQQCSFGGSGARGWERKMAKNEESPSCRHRANSQIWIYISLYAHLYILLPGQSCCYNDMKYEKWWGEIWEKSRKNVSIIIWLFNEWIHCSFCFCSLSHSVQWPEGIFLIFFGF